MKSSETVMITGASEGIGRSFAEVFAEKGHSLVLVARNQTKLNELAMSLEAKYRVRCLVFPADLTLSDAPETLLAACEKASITVDILVNNAGMMQVEKIQRANSEVLNNLLTLNINSLVNMTQTFVKPMVDRGSGRIMNVGSIASFMPTPNFSAYGASKAFVLSFSEGISEDLKGTGVTVTCVCPGMTETKMLGHAEGLEKYIPSFLKAQPKTLAQDAYKAMIKGDVVFLDKLANKLLVQWATHYPRWLVRSVNGLLSNIK